MVLEIELAPLVEQIYAGLTHIDGIGFTLHESLRFHAFERDADGWRFEMRSLCNGKLCHAVAARKEHQHLPISVFKSELFGFFPHPVAEQLGDFVDEHTGLGFPETFSVSDFLIMYHSGLPLLLVRKLIKSI